MDIARVVPNITTELIEESAEFYCGLFGFEVAMDMDWIVTLASPSTNAAQISLVRGDRAAGVDDRITLSIDVSDVDSVYERALANNCDIAYDLTDESWGVRRFHVRDPNGVLVNVLTHIKSAG